LSNGSFTPGKNARTFNDTAIAPSDFALTGRSALPNALSAQVLFAIVKNASSVYLDTAAPNDSHADDGIDVFVPTGHTPLQGRLHRIPRRLSRSSLPSDDRRNVATGRYAGYGNPCA